jgi:anti-sigma28 factor (negative regulator of flagellin synthesis)
MVFNMTALALRFPSRGRSIRPLETTKTRFQRDAGSKHRTADTPITTKIEDLRARVERGAYTVDAEKVADAIVARLVDGRSVRESARR